MKRFHVHVHVPELAASIAFYTRLFGVDPTRVERDYAKWMLEDPAVNFAISSRGGATGIDHLGFQTDDPAELSGMKARALAADMALLDEGETTCCYARSEKHWVTDPSGIAWEHFHTLAGVPMFSEVAEGSAAEACCPTATAPEPVPEQPQKSCCGPRTSNTVQPAPQAASSSACC